MKKTKQVNNGGSRLKIIPLGGLEQIGMNITAFEYEDSIVVVDCGLSFPDDDMLGIDMVIPDITYLKDNIEKVKGFVITHGHEDHIGALPYILKQMNIPVYATRLTMGIIENLGQFRIEFIKTNHSIVDAAALAIYSPAGTVVHTGDFKVDYTPVFGDAIDLQRFAEIGKKGVLALLCESTNAERPGFTPSERTLSRTFDTIFHEHPNKRIIIATFASNVDRVQQIINSAYKYNRKVVVEGRSMVNIIDTAMNLGCLNIPENTLINIEQLKNYPDERTVIITTGSQGESMAALSRMAASVHRKISITPNDVIIFSSNPIPGNEKAVTKVINELLTKGAEVIFQDAHVSGHACQEEIKLIYTLVHPRYAVPIHGEFKHRQAQQRIAVDLGLPKENVFMLSSGDVLELDSEKAQVTGKVPVGAILVDGLGVGKCGAQGPSASGGGRHHDRGSGSGFCQRTACGRTGSGFPRLCICEGIGRADGRSPGADAGCSGPLHRKGLHRLGQNQIGGQGFPWRLYLEKDQTPSHDPPHHHGCVIKEKAHAVWTETACTAAG